MSGFKVNFSVNNQLATPSIHAAALANRPAAGQVGRVFIDSDNPSTGIYRDTGTAWVVIGMPSSPEADTLQTVTDRGNTTTQSITVGSASAPSATLDVHGSGVIAILQGTGTNDSFLQFNKSGNGKFKVGNVHNAGNDYFTVYNLQENSDAILVNISTNNVAIGGGTVTPTYKLDITGSLRNTGNAYFATAGGNAVGIGTTSITAGTTLDVNGNFYFRNLGTAGIFGGTTNNEIITFNALSATGGVTARMIWTNNTMVFRASTNSALSLGANNLSDQLRIATTGNILINTSGVDSGYKLDVNGSFRADNIILQTSGGYREIRTSLAAGLRIINSAGPLWLEPSSHVLFFSPIRAASSGLPLQYILLNNGESINTNNGYGYNWGLNIGADGTSVMQIFTGGNILFQKSVTKTSTNQASALVEMVSTTQGFLPPRMTTAQKNLIANTAGLVVFDTTLAKLCVNSGAGWETITSV